MEKRLPQRKRNRICGFDYSTPKAYFLTICTMERRNYFWTVGATIGRPQEPVLSNYGKVVQDAITRISEIYPMLRVEHYVIMPDHVHLLVRIQTDEDGRPMVAPTISRVVQQMKGYVTKRIGVPVWQKLFYDHIIRDLADYEEHVRYIRENPMHWLDELNERKERYERDF